MKKINIIKELHDSDEEFIYNSLGIENHSINSNSRLRFLFNQIRENEHKIDGDCFEFGVFRGASLISTAILLKRLNSKKKVYGFDSFNGFPSYHRNDDTAQFNELNFSDSHRKKLAILLQLKKLFSQDTSISRISSSGDFSNTSKSLILDKIDKFELDNIVLVESDFKETVPLFFEKYQGSIFCSNLDCDLYEGYKLCLPFILKYGVINSYHHLDEYFSLKFPGARIATDEFVKISGIKLQKNSVRQGEFERWFFIKDREF